MLHFNNTLCFNTIAQDSCFKIKVLHFNSFELKLNIYNITDFGILLQSSLHLIGYSP